MTANQQMTASQKLNLFTLPLRGSALIEASAGTGKTFTIAALYLRAVLGHSGGEYKGAVQALAGMDGQNADSADSADTGALPPLLPNDILVVTFTEAATAELTDRIRARLAHAARYFRGEVTEADAILTALAQSFAAEAWPQCAMRLELASQSMDEAAVSTIHSWCQRMLAEHAFDSGSSFEESLSSDQSALLAEVVQDYWRSFVYALNESEFFRYQQCYATPEQLQKALQQVWQDAGMLSSEPATARQNPAQLIKTEQKERHETLTRLKAPWPAWLLELRLLFAKARQEKRINGSQLREDYLQNWLGALERWATEPQLIQPELSDSAWHRLSPDGIAQASKGEALQHPAFDAIAKLQVELARIADCQEGLRQHALCWCRQRFAKAQLQQGEFGFDDLLSRFADALEGSKGEQLAARVRAQFPLALIDEFQDTDPVQYRIFRQIYQPEHNRQDSALLLIGDPKQAIYAFRGADIFTYLQAKQATAPRHYSLDTNFRSTSAMVQVVNQLFLQPEQRETGDGAFLFRPRQNLVAFSPVQAAGRKEIFYCAQKQMPALQVCYLDESDKALSKSSYLAQMARACANQICRLLNAGATAQAGFVMPGKDELKQELSQEFKQKLSQNIRPLQPADIAVLVNNQQEADEIRGALLESGIRSVYLSDKGSVFQTAIAHDLLLWLEACSDPGHELKLRSALGAQSLGWNYAELARLQQDEWFFALWQDKFIEFSKLWRSQGVLPLVRRLLQDFDLVSRFAGKKDGERQLTDLLHLAELLQQASRGLEGELALLRYFKDHLAGELALDADALKLRLESDEALVRVVTIHKSKGLEYPLVFLPFIAAARPLDPANLPYRYHDDAGQLQLCYQKDDTIFAKAERERLGEDLRKLYVALTRAQHYCWLALAPLKDSSAIAYLLDDSALLPPGELTRLLSQWQHPAVALSAFADEPADYFQAAAEQPAIPAQPYATVSKRNYLPWWTASYSALAAGAGAGADDHEHAQPGPNAVQQSASLFPRFDTSADGPELAKNSELYRELSKEQADGAAEAGIYAYESYGQAQQPSAATMPLISQQFLRGAAAGTFLHDMLEWAALEGFATVAAAPELLTAQLIVQSQKLHWLWQDKQSLRWQRRLLVTDALEQPEFQSAEEAVAEVANWLSGLLTANWRCGNALLSLASLTQYQSELEFWLSARLVQTKNIDALLQQYLWPALARPALQPQQLNGMLKGFIDLTFSADGRFHVADYKSNYLPDGQYDESALIHIMLDHRYDLQAALYGLALHRLLGSRLPGYHIEQHLGQAYYWFVRGGGDGQSANAGMLCCELPPALILALDKLFSGNTAVEGAAHGVC
nr:exodeoxyribonuclease V subunit beta [Rheinheimera sp. 4Y26]